MNPQQASSDDFPRVSGAKNFDVWKARVSASLDGKHLLGFVTKKDYNGVSDDEDEDSDDDLAESDGDEAASKPRSPADIDSDEVDFGDSSDELQPSEYDDTPSSKKTKRADPPIVRPIAERNVSRDRKQVKRRKPTLPSARLLRHMEPQSKAFLMKTMDDTHIRLVKNLTTAFDIFQAICTKYEGAAFHGDPYFIQHFLMEIKYEEGGDLTSFFLELENAMKAASEATGSPLTDGQKSLYLFHSMPKTWKDDLRVWKGVRKYIPYDELKMSIETKVREIQAQERYSRIKGTPESQSTQAERALIAPSQDSALAVQASVPVDVCSYCQKPRHNIRQCRALQKDLRDGCVKAGTVLPANFELRGPNNYRSHPYHHNNNNNQGRSGRGGGSWHQSGRGGRGGGRGRGNYGGNRKNGNNNGNNNNNNKSSRRDEGGYDQSRRKETLIAVVSNVQTDASAISLTAQPSQDFDFSWTIDSGCSSHVTQHEEWYKTKTLASGGITVGGKSQVPVAKSVQLLPRCRGVP
ncbi:hypothetical protein P3T76_012450 [Phytophthora citrophthora]|uniref:Retrotransposon Copia-like N-terminal domain-containing protein n=1 Tax=Phytophthora citrophthora TaxID=4793 RepID=A0AAD9G570_9STRA|nr:hypothetical protein P3T76_012450 [Phytophthora citrophthora]